MSRRTQSSRELAARRRPETGFGTPAVRSRFRGPYAAGPPAADLEVDPAPIGTFGLAELVRLVAVYAVLSTSILAKLARWALWPRRRALLPAASQGAVDGLIRLGPTYVKLGQLVASSPGLFPEPL
ncbi:MAG: hypothetical protein ACRDYY_13855, partial [Acidimicrobiales bacterium]